MKKEKSYQEHPSFSSKSASHSSSSSPFIHSSVSLLPASSCVGGCDLPSQAEGPAQRAVCFPHCRPSLFDCPLRISPVPPFDPLRSLVIFGRVSDTSVCLGNRSGRLSGVCGAAAAEGETHDGGVGGRVGGVVKKE